MSEKSSQMTGKISNGKSCENTKLQKAPNSLLEQEREKIDYNIKTIYKLKDKDYPELAKALEGSKRASIKPRKLLLKVLRFIKDKELIFDKSVNRYIFFLDTKTITYLLRKKTNLGVSNKTINYLCAIGCLNKIEQRYMPDYPEFEKLNDFNKKFLEEHTLRNIPINCFYFELYNPEELEKMEMRASRLNKAEITSSNIANDTLIYRDLKSFSEDVYKMNVSAIGKKINILKEIYECIDSCIKDKGYCTKKDIYENVEQKNKDIDNVLRMAKKELKEIYIFKAPNKADKERYHLENQDYIYIKK